MIENFYLGNLRSVQIAFNNADQTDPESYYRASFKETIDCMKTDND